MTQLTPEQLAEIVSFANEHDNFNYSPATAAEHMDALLSHIDALSLAERHAVREYAKWFEQCVQHEERIAALTAEIAALRRDAERYRWLRSSETEVHGIAFIGIAGPGGISRFTDEHADTAIDSAMSPKVLPEREG